MANSGGRSGGGRATRPPITERGEITPPDGEQRAAKRSLAALLAELGTEAAADGDLRQLVDAVADGLGQIAAAKHAAETGLAQAEADAAALRVLLGTQREQLHDLRQQVERANEALQEQRSYDGRQLYELTEKYRELVDRYRESRIQTDTIYGVFDHLRSTVLTGVWQIFGPSIRDSKLYEEVTLILANGLFDDAYFCEQCRPGEIARGPASIIYYLRNPAASGRDPHPLFSTRFYSSQLPEARQSGNALIDYLKSGHDLAPHPLFRPSYYLSRLPGLANLIGIAPLAHYCVAGAVGKGDPHPLFDSDYYAAQLTTAGRDIVGNPLAFYLQTNRDRISPHPLFDAEYYERRYPDVARAEIDPLVHYVLEGDARGYNPHPYFHTRYYRHANPDVAADGDATLVHFVLMGAGEGRAPHPMFDIAYYARSHPQIAETGYRLLVHFIDEGEEQGLSPHPLIDLTHVKRQLAERGLDDSRPFRALLDPANIDWLSPHPLFDVPFYRSVSPQAAAFAGGAFLYYLLAGHRRDDPVHPLFDSGFYRAQANAAGIELVDPLSHFLTTRSETALNPHPLFSTLYYQAATAPGENPLLHYLARGDAQGRNPHPLFDTAYYKRNVGIEHENALLHYLSGAETAADPHVLFDTEYYRSRLDVDLLPGTSPLAHYLSGDGGETADPHPLFDQDFYGQQVADDERGREPTLVHYITQGAAGRSPHPCFDPEFFGAADAGSDHPALAAFLEQFERERGSAVPLHRLDFREANRDFCSLSYVLGHPELPAGAVPLVHFLRGRKAEEFPPVRQRRQGSRSDPNSLGYRPIGIDPQRLFDCARERRRRDDAARFVDASASRRIIEDDYQKLGAQLAGIAFLGPPPATDRDLVAEVATTRKLAILAVDATSAGRLAAGHRLLAKALQHAGYATVTVADPAALNGSGDLPDLVAADALVPSAFVAWTAALAHFAPALLEADHLLFLSDNLVGPFGDLSPLLRRLERHPAEIRGLTETIDGGRALQADFLMASGDAVTTGALPRWFLAGLATTHRLRSPQIPLDALGGAGKFGVALTPYAAASKAWLDSVPAQIDWARRLPERIDELGLTSHLPPAVAGRYAEYLEDWLSDRAVRIAGGEGANPQHVFWNTLIGPAFPFINKELLLFNPLRVPTLIRLGEALRHHRDSPATAVLHDLVPGKSAYPRSYLRLSDALIASAAVMA